VLQRSIDMIAASGGSPRRGQRVPRPIGRLPILVRSFSCQSTSANINPPRRRAGQLLPLNLKAIGVVPRPNSPSISRPGIIPEPVDRRRVWFEGNGLDTPVYQRDELPCGFQFPGPRDHRAGRCHHGGAARASGDVDKYLNIMYRWKE